MCSGSRRRHGRAGAAAGDRRKAWRLRAMQARRGGAMIGPARGRERRRGRRAGTWHRGERRGGGWCSAHGRRARRGSDAEKTEEEGAGGRRWGLMCNSPKVQGLYCKA
jgi:hypothetical protein